MPSGALELTRRGLLARAGGGALALAAGPASLALGRRARPPRIHGYPFTLGVASGDPLPDGVVLWTRLAPDPLHGGGMPDRAVPVRWQLAEDERFRRVVRRGTARAAPYYAHSVHVEVGGLRPRREDLYRLAARGGSRSRSRRTATAMPSTRRIRTSRPRTPRRRSWSPGTTTTSRTTTPAISISTARRPPAFCAGARRPTAPSTSTCRCAAARSP